MSIRKAQSWWAGKQEQDLAVGGSSAVCARVGADKGIYSLSTLVCAWQWLYCVVAFLIFGVHTQPCYQMNLTRVTAENKTGDEKLPKP